MPRPSGRGDAERMLAQFRAGNIWTSVASQEDVVQTKRDVPPTLLRQAPAFGTTISPVITFGYEGDSPFKDTRVRQALSMMIDREAFIDVIDNGTGLPKENRSRLLEPYVTTREKGTGLGLAIVGRILEEHGGKIELRDAAERIPGQRGARMRLQFAAAPVASEQEQKTAAARH